jgi:hypothetical protein
VLLRVCFTDGLAGSLLAVYVDRYVCRPKCYWPGGSPFQASPEALSREALARKCTEKQGLDAGTGDDLVFICVDCRGDVHEFRPGHDEGWAEIAPETVMIYIRPLRRLARIGPPLQGWVINL